MEELNSMLLTPTKCFLFIWNEQIQQKIVYESNAYIDYVDSKSRKRKGGVPPSATITLQEYQQFCSIVILMGIRKQPCLRDY